MPSDLHERARFLIDESRVAGISPEDAAWLRAHTAECPECERYEEVGDRILRGLASFSFEFGPPELARPAARGLTAAAGPIPTVRPRRPSWRWALVAAALVVLAAVPVYRNLAAARQEREDALLLEGVDRRVSRTVPAAMEPLVQPRMGEAR